MIPRYTRPEMAALWSDAHRYSLWLRVELAVTRALEKRGMAPAGTVAAIEARQPLALDPARIEDIEHTTRHDVIAFLTHLEELVGDPARFLHFGLTSSDVVDTALALQLKAAGELIDDALARLLAALRARAWEHKSTPMMGRSHGIHAEPTSFGLVLASYYAMVARARDRFAAARASIAYGQASGAVGTFAHLHPDIEAEAMAELGLSPEPVSTQVIPRDRHADYFSALAQVGAAMEHIAVNLRHFQRSEVGEVEEPFDAGQKGSSAMPHKRNPISSENLCGLARLLRSHALAALESVALWHERDISHSSVERVIGPDATTIAHYGLHRLAGVVERMVVYPEKMRANLDRTGGLWNSQQVLLALTRAGLARQDAYVLVQRNAMKTLNEGTPFLQLLLADTEVRALLGEDEIRALFDLGPHLAHVDAVFARVWGPF